MVRLLNMNDQNYFSLYLVNHENLTSSKRESCEITKLFSPCVFFTGNFEPQCFFECNQSLDLYQGLATLIMD